MFAYIKEKWVALMSWFKDSETIFLARTEMFFGALFTVAASFDFTVFMTAGAPRWIGYAMFAQGLVSELMRRARAEDM